MWINQIWGAAPMHIAYRMYKLLEMGRLVLYIILDIVCLCVWYVTTLAVKSNG